jgi:DNA-binding NarL/FixJ family response regulator
MRLVVIDDHPIFREGLVAILAAEPDMTIVAQGESAEDAASLAEQLQPDILLLDLGIPGDGLVALRRITAAAPASRVIVLTACEQEGAVLAAMQCGAKGYVLKGVSARKLISIIREVAAGAGYVPPELAVHMLASVARAREEPQPARLIEKLNGQEQAILELVAGGLSNRQIAAALGLTEIYIKNHLSMIMRKLQVNNRVEAAMLAGRVAWDSSGADRRQ